MKKIILLSVVLFTAICAFGQEASNGKAINLNSLKYNWFFQVQGGPSFTFSEDYKEAGLGDIIAPHAAISIGKHFAPAVGARVQFGGWKTKNYDHSIKDTYSRNYFQANLDGMLNLSNVFIPYTHEKAFNVYALAGLGYVHGLKNDDRGIGSTNNIVPRAGLQLDYRLSNVISINLEAMGNLMNDDFNGRVHGKKYDGTLNVMAGLTFKLGGNGFKVVDYADPAVVARLENDVKNQQAMINERNVALGEKDGEISVLKTELAKKPETIVSTETIELEEIVMNAVVVFKIGRSELQDNQEINIYNAAKYFQDNPNMNIRVTGYADRATGNPTINQRLSEQRAEAVKKILINKYKIDASRITAEGGGDKVQPFANDAWNRVAIFTAVPKR